MAHLPVDGGYSDSTKRLAEFGSVVCGIIKSILDTNSLQVHSVSFRVKQKDSADRKLLKKTSRYTGYRSLTDLLGVRIITHFSDDVDRVSAMLSEEFDVDAENSIDKRAELEPDRFGYLSLHQILSLTTARAKMIEYRKYSDIKFEVQIRSILQHTWAEIEHDLGYKSDLALPRPLKREFSILAGALESADRQFLSLRDAIYSYRLTAKEKVHELDKDIEIDQESIIVYLRENNVAADLDRALARMVVGKRVQLVDDPADALSMARKIMDLTGIGTIAEMHSILRSDVPGLLSFAAAFQTAPSVVEEEEMLSQEDYSVELAADVPVEGVNALDRGICLFYLLYYLLAQVPLSERQQMVGNAYGRMWSEEEIEQVAKDLGYALAVSRGEAQS